MNCFPCFQSQRSKRSNSKEQLTPDLGNNNDPRASPPPSVNIKSKQSADVKTKKDEASTIDTGNIAAKNFTFRELAAATKNFRQEFLLGEGGFGRVYKGTLQPSGQVVAVKQLDRNGTQGNKEFLVEVSTLSLLNHDNLLNLVGYCADGDQRLLVYDYMPLGSLEDQLLEVKADKSPLDWQTRMKIASGAAQGLEYLHEKANPPVIYRDLKSSNILLNEEFNPKLSDFGLDKLGPAGNKMHISPRVIGSYGYCAPEYESKGELTLKSDIYSFGVVLLELITGRRAIDTARPIDEQNLVTWAQPIFKDPKRFPEMADPLLGRHFPVRSLNQAVGIAAMCLQEEPSVRPLISDVVAALSFLTLVPDEPAPSLPDPIPSSDGKTPLEAEDNHREDEDSGKGNGVRNKSNHDDGDSTSHSDGDHHDEVGSDHDDGGSSENSDHEDWDSVNHNDEDSSDEHQKEVKKSITWNLNSVQKRKLEDEDGSVSSSSRSNSIVEPQDGDSGTNLAHHDNMDVGEKSIGSDSRCSSKSGSFDGSFRSNSGHMLNSESISYTEYQVGCGDSNLMHTSCMKSLNGSMGSNNSCNSNILFQDESVSSY